MYETQIAAGAVLLDEQVPGWRERVNVDMLWMREVHQCILGQVTSGYWQGVEMLGLTELEDVVAHGFCISGSAQDEWGTLTREWVEFLQAPAE